MHSLSLGGYVLAGGRSTRMGQDKALLPLAGRSLLEHAVSKLRHVTDEVYILANRPELAAFAPIVPDLRQDCGPVGGFEAALSHTRREWVLVLPVDMPFVPLVLLQSWVHFVLERKAARAALFVIDEVPQPALCLLHREILPFITSAVLQGRFKLYPVLEEATRALAHRHSAPPSDVFLRQPWNGFATMSSFLDKKGKQPGDLTQAQRSALHLWFANLNTPEEFQEAQLHLDALDV
jgi:molybdenum cofactor guanylyltransferase